MGGEEERRKGRKYRGEERRLEMGEEEKRRRGEERRNKGWMKKDGRRGMERERREGRKVCPITTICRNTK